MGIQAAKLFGFNQLPAARPVGLESGRAQGPSFGNTNPIQNTQGLAARIEAAAPYERSPETRSDILGQKLYCLG